MATGTGSSKPSLIGSEEEQRLGPAALFGQPQTDACVRSKEDAKVLELINLFQLTRAADQIRQAEAL
ncbi:g6354 [Coccomyxa elongata]